MFPAAVLIYLFLSVILILGLCRAAGRGEPGGTAADDRPQETKEPQPQKHDST